MSRGSRKKAAGPGWSTGIWSSCVLTRSVGGPWHVPLAWAPAVLGLGPQKGSAEDLTQLSRRPPVGDTSHRLLPPHSPRPTPRCTSSHKATKEKAPSLPPSSLIASTARPCKPPSGPFRISEVPSASVSTNQTSTETSTKFIGAPTTPESPAEEHSSSHTPTSHASAELVLTETTPQATVPAKVTCVLIDIETTTASPRVIMQEVEHALSSGSIAAITVTVIAVVLLVFGVAAYLKIRHSSYGRLLDDHDYGSWGNYNNPLYDDS
ncbi:hypothetical protein CB1_001109041 [Camelus ferus]|nr:hypothetical protein CB1_001109041 [Camelus ferus]